jgi:hypothetical protein
MPRTSELLGVIDGLVLEIVETQPTVLSQFAQVCRFAAARQSCYQKNVWGHSFPSGIPFHRKMMGQTVIVPNIP